MFSFFSKKNKKPPYQELTESGFSRFISENIVQQDSTIQKSADIESLIKSNIIKKDDFPRIDWHSFFQSFDQLPTKTQKKIDAPEFYNCLQFEWFLKMKNQMEGYQINKSDNFLLLSAASEKQLLLIFPFLESVYKRILRILSGVALPRDGEKLAIILFENIDDYYHYISHYYPDDGEYGMSGGVFMTGGLGHFVLPDSEMSQLESVVSHELTHALLNHLTIPLWVNEGLAVNTETAITGYSPYLLNAQKHNKHIDYWNENTIQEFWSGISFAKSGVAAELSYQLAQLLVRSLSEDFEQFKLFANSASFEDSGETAAIKIYGGSLGSLIEGIYGEGDWSPKAELWKQNAETLVDLEI